MTEHERRVEGWPLPETRLGWPYEATKDRLHEYWATHTRHLRADFEGTRQQELDTGVRGGQNEKHLAGFLKVTLHRRRVFTNVSIINSAGHQSGELDIVVCNEDQPLLGDDSRAPRLIIEGVDFVVQVKARLNSREIERIRGNCMSLKLLHKMRAEDDDQDRASGGIGARFLDYVPYLSLATTPN